MKKFTLKFPIILIMFLLGNVAFAATFPDVPDNTVNNKAVEYLKQKNIIKGYDDGTFQPEKTINRAEALKIVMLAAGLQSASSSQAASTQETQQATQQSGTPIKFPDVKESDWFYRYVQDGFSNQIVSGYPDGTFKPANNINVAESLKIIEAAFRAELNLALTDNPYPDVDKTVWFAPYADYGKKKQIIWTLDDGKLHAERDITRGEFAQIIYRLVYIRDNKLDQFPLSTDWPEYVHPSDHYAIKVPFDWQKIPAGTQTVFWKEDEGNKQVSFARVYPNSATAVVAVDHNSDGLNLDDYLARIQYSSSAVVKKVTLNKYPFASVSIAGEGIADYYFEFPNHQILIIYSQTGSGYNRPQLSEQIRYMVGSVRYNEGTAQPAVSAAEQFLSLVRKNILVSGKGQETLNLFSDLVLIETDSIGIGTGPVDYYYSSKYNVTLKLERNSNLVLAIQETKTTAF